MPIDKVSKAGRFKAAAVLANKAAARWCTANCDAKSGLASGMQSTIRQVGAAMGIALLGSVFVLLLTNGARREITHVGEVSPAQRAVVLRSIERTGGAVLGLSNITSDSARAAARDAIDDAFVHAARWTAFAAAGFVLLGLIAAAQIPAPARSAEISSEEADQAGTKPDN